jgi:O-antigen ligase
MLAAAHVLLVWIDNRDEDVLLSVFGFWFAVGFALGLSLLLVELLTAQGMQTWLVSSFEIFKKHNSVFAYRHDGSVEIVKSYSNRNVASLALLLWPALLCAVASWHANKTMVVVLGVALAAITVFAGYHETSKVAIVVSTIIFALATFWSRATVRAIAIGWITVVLGILPLAHFGYNSLKLQNASWLQTSAQERIRIWGDIAKLTLAAPIFGIGARSTQSLKAFAEKTAAKQASTSPPRLARHPHNVYLQVWYELGAVGAVLFLVAGLVLIYQVSLLPEGIVPFGLATLTVGLVEIGSSFDIWQPWFFALLTLSPVLFCLGFRRTRRLPPSKRDTISCSIA